MLEMNRRSLITGLVSFIAAPAIVRAGSLMPVKLYDPELYDFAAPDPLIDQFRALSKVKTFRLVISQSTGTKAPVIQLIEELSKE